MVAEDARIEDAVFIAEAREGWPIAIRRAMAAEAEVERMKHSYRLLLACYDGQSARAHEYYSELEAVRKERDRLREVLETIGGRRSPMWPRSQMQRMARQALDSLSEVNDIANED